MLASKALVHQIVRFTYNCFCPTGLRLKSDHFSNLNLIWCNPICLKLLHCHLTNVEIQTKVSVSWITVDSVPLNEPDLMAMLFLILMTCIVYDYNSFEVY